MMRPNQQVTILKRPSKKEKQTISMPHGLDTTVTVYEKAIKMHLARDANTEGVSESSNARQKLIITSTPEGRLVR